MKVVEPNNKGGIPVALGQSLLNTTRSNHFFVLLFFYAPSPPRLDNGNSTELIAYNSSPLGVLRLLKAITIIHKAVPNQIPPKAT